MWAFRLLILALLEPQTGQQNGFSPVCILMCIISFCFEMNFLLHWSHWWSQDSCLRKNIVEVLRIEKWKKKKKATVDQIIMISVVFGHLPHVCLLTKVESTAQAMLLSTCATAPAFSPSVQGLPWSNVRFFTIGFLTWWSSKVSLCRVEKSHPGSEHVNLFGCRWTYLKPEISAVWF